VINETAEDFRGHVELVLLKDGHIIVACQEIACHVAPRSSVTFESEAILEGFYDVAYAYRFGPPKHDVAIATLLDEQRGVISEAHDFPVGREPELLYTLSLATSIERLADGSRELTLRTDRFLRNVKFEVKGFLPDDNYFHLSPLRPRAVRFHASKPAVDKFAGYLDALNLRSSIKIT
jgi:beta-mannosidase